MRRSNPGDVEIRELERRLAAGDPDAAEPLVAQLERVGDGPRLEQVFRATGSLRALVGAVRLGLRPLHHGDQVRLVVQRIGITSIPGLSTPEGYAVVETEVQDQTQVVPQRFVPEVVSETLAPGDVEFPLSTVGSRYGWDALRVSYDGRVTHEVRPRRLRHGAVTEEFTSTPVLKLEVFPSIVDTARSHVREGDKLYVRFGEGYGTRVVDVTKVQEAPPIDGRVRIYTTSGRTFRGPSGGSLEVNPLMSRVFFQPTLMTQMEQVTFLTIVPKAFKKPRRKPEGKRPIRLGTKTSRALFAKITRAHSWSFDDQYGSSENEIDPAWARENLEASAMRSGIKSITENGPGHYTIRYHSNRHEEFWTTEGVPAPTWSGDVDPAVYAASVRAAELRQPQIELREPEPAEPAWPGDVDPAAWVDPPSRSTPDPSSRRSTPYLVVNTQTEEVYSAHPTAAAAEAAMQGMPPDAWGAFPYGVVDDRTDWRRGPRSPEPPWAAPGAPPALPQEPAAPATAEDYGVAPDPDPDLAARGAEYRSRIEDKRARLLAAAGRARARAGQLGVSARRMGDMIPMGQPILVGHHSEKRHRRDLARITGQFGKSFQEGERAEGLEYAASRIGTAGISADDPLAIQQLEAELVEARQGHAIAKKANADMRRLVGSASKKGQHASKDAHYAAIEQLQGVPEASKEQLRRTAFAFPWLPQFDMGGINARIKRIEGRIAELRTERARPEATAPLSYDGFTVQEDRELNRLQLVFVGKPGPKTRAVLKRNGFRWSPNAGAWQRQLNEASRRAVSQVVAELGPHGGWQQNPY